MVEGTSVETYMADFMFKYVQQLEWSEQCMVEVDAATGGWISLRS